MLKNLKALFIVEEQGKESSKTAESTTAPDPGNAPIRQESAEGDAGKVTTKFMNVLFSAMEQNNLSGFDYLEFKQSLKSLEKMPMDEATRFQSAFAMAQTMGATPQKLVDSAGHYLKVLHQEEQKFETALQKQKEQQIGNKQQQIQDIEKAVQSKAEQIKALTQEIEVHRKESEKLQSEIRTSTVKVESTKNDFIASYNTLVNQIQVDVEHMKKYLK